MFTGLVEAMGSVSAVSPTPAGIGIRIECPWPDVAVGESISVMGICLTVLECGPGWFEVAAMLSTDSRTTVATWSAGTRVNLERAMRADARLGGHIVQGHVDGIGSVERVERAEDSVLLDLRIPTPMAETLVLHGSVAVDGVSLTVNALEGDKLQVALIEHTLRNTTLGGLAAGDTVNVETDVIGKHVRRLMEPWLRR